MNFAYFSIINGKKYPDQEFLIERNAPESKYPRRSLTWREFNEQTNRIANYLRDELDVQTGDTVLHLQMNSLEWYVTFFAILKAGASAVPLSFRFASQDISHAAEACQPKALILGDSFFPRILPITDAMPSIKKYVCIGEDCPEGMIPYDYILQKGSPADILMKTDDAAPAELMFTSGTTGPPKPVCQAHRTLYDIGICNALTYDEGKETVFLAPQPFYHSGSFFLSFPCYMSGGKVVILNDLAPKTLLSVISEEKINNTWITVPTMCDAVEAIKRGEININDYDFSHFTGSLVIGAQPVPPSLLQDIKDIFPVKTGNIYGITEGGGGGSLNLYDKDVIRKPGSIGKPTFYMDARVVDDDGMDVPIGGVGELLIKGPRVMKEYYSNPEMTAATLKDGWLYTGDLVKVDDEGYYYIVDRKKDLIIRGGENIFPVEIEAVIFSHPKVMDVAVIGYPHPRLVEIVMAIVTLHNGDTLTGEDIIAHCKQAGLAKFKWPERFVFDTVIRNPTGKVDKPKLREIYVGKKEVTVTGQMYN